jgi:hypothetical protein
MTLCAVCTVHVEMRSTSFLVEPQNQGHVSWFSLKTKVDGSPDLASKPVATILVVWHQNHSLGFPDLGPKTDGCGLVIWASRSMRQFLGLGLTAKQATICRLRHKTDGRMIHGAHIEI